MTEDHYPEIFERVKAILIDSVVIVGFMFAISYTFDRYEDIPTYARITAFVFIYLLYDPLFSSVFGGTIGHLMLGIRVKRESNEHKNILFPLAILRYIFKTLLGVISLLTISGDEKRKAIHDHIVGSVVIYAKAKGNIN